jgi:hypothetical protein
LKESVWQNFEEGTNMETVNLLTRTYPISELKEHLQRALATYDLRIEEKTSKVVGYDGFSVEPATLVVSGAGVLSALITALLTYMQARATGTITIEGRTGRKVVVPRGTSPEDIERYVKLARELDADVIIVE